MCGWSGMDHDQNLSFGHGYNHVFGPLEAFTRNVDNVLFGKTLYLLNTAKRTCLTYYICPLGFFPEVKARDGAD